MEWIKRYYEDRFNFLFQPGKVLVIYGSRQVGKTSLINRMVPDDATVFKGDGNDMEVNEILSSQKLYPIKNAFKGYNIVFIDEAHKVSNIGQALKLITDHLPEVSIIASGSSSFDLSNKLGEPLTGRQNVFFLYPVSVLELVENVGRMRVIQQLENLLIFGNYPETLTCNNNEERIQYLHNVRNSLLLKDILELENIKNSAKLFDLLRLLAYQIGNEVSLNELSRQLEIAKQTVERYIDLLEKAFVIKKVEGFSGNLRKEVTKMHRYYFWDNGIRNAVINNFNMVKFRDDIGMLWENFLFMERIKTQEYLRIHSNNYFWRTYNQKEIDMVEERGGKLHGYEFKWQPKKVKPPKLWLDSYDNADYHVIDKNNFLAFLCNRDME